MTETVLVKQFLDINLDEVDHETKDQALKQINKAYELLASGDTEIKENNDLVSMGLAQFAVSQLLPRD